jgi:predicted DNA-binding transcriptional regulator AlpA
MPRHVTEHLTQEDQRVLSLKEWAKLNGFSWMTGKRLIAAGEGPTVLQLSPRRIGIRMIDNARWQATRLRSAESAVRS